MSTSLDVKKQNSRNRTGTDEDKKAADPCFTIGDIVSALPADEASNLEKWSTMSRDEWDELEQWAKVEEATMGAKSAIDDEETTAERRKSKARKWLMNWIHDCERQNQKKIEEYGVEVQGIYKTLAYAAWFLDQGRRDFGVYKIRWVDGLRIELQILAGAGNDSLTLEIVQKTLRIVIKMQEQGMAQYIAAVFEECKTIAKNMYDQYYSQNSSSRIGVRGRMDLFNIMNNIACLELEQGDREGCKEMIRCAANLIEDSDDDADVFLLNSGSLLVVDNDIVNAQILLRRAVKIAEGKLESKTQGVKNLEVAIIECKAELIAARDQEIQVLPMMGVEFVVRIEDNQVKKMSTRVPELQEKLEKLQMEAFEIHENVESFRLRVMRAYRKLGNFYGRMFTTKQHLAWARQFSQKVQNTAKACKHVPLKDLMGNASFILDSVFQSAAVEARFKERRAFFAQAMEICDVCIHKVEATYGLEHTHKRAAEVYEKAAVAAMLNQREPEEVTRLAQAALNIRAKTNPAGDMYTARGLLCLSEAWAYSGEFEDAISIAQDAYQVATDLLGPRHIKVKQLKKTCVEHKKIMMKCSSSGMGKIQMRQTARRMIMAKMEQRSWIKEWAM